MNTKEAKATLKSLGIAGEFTKRKNRLDVKVNPQSFDAVSGNIKNLKSQGFYMRLYGKCSADNMNPETPNEMEQCDSCYLTVFTYC